MSADFPLELENEDAEIMLNSTTTAATDPTGMESRSDVFVDAYEYLPEGMESSSSDVFVDAYEYLPEGMESSSDEERPQTPGQEPTPATDVLETEPMFDYAQPSTSAAVLSGRKPSSSPTDAPAQNNLTEKHTKGRKGRSRLGRAWKAVKRGFQTISKLCPCVPDREPSQERPQTPGQEPTPAKATDLTLIFPNEPRLQKKYFQCFYKVGKKLGYDDRVHKGIRRSDGRKVAIRFVDRRRLLEALEMPDSTLLKLQKPPTCEHIIRLYDRFIMEDKYILIMERFPACVTLSEFIRRNRGGLTEETVTHIMWQIFVAISHCMDRGAFMIMCRVTEQSILINPKTLQIKFADFDEVYFPRSENNPHESRRKFYFLYLLNSLINEISHPPGKGVHLFRECQELRRQLVQGLEELYSLENMFE